MKHETRQLAQHAREKAPGVVRGGCDIPGLPHRYVGNVCSFCGKPRRRKSELK